MRRLPRGDLELEERILARHPRSHCRCCQCRKFHQRIHRQSFRLNGSLWHKHGWTHPCQLWLRMRHPLLCRDRPPADLDTYHLSTVTDADKIGQLLLHRPMGAEIAIRSWTMAYIPERGRRKAIGRPLVKIRTLHLSWRSSFQTQTSDSCSITRMFVLKITTHADQEVHRACKRCADRGANSQASVARTEHSEQTASEGLCQ